MRVLFIGARSTDLKVYGTDLVPMSAAEASDFSACLIRSPVDMYTVSQKNSWSLIFFPVTSQKWTNFHNLFHY